MDKTYQHQIISLLFLPQLDVLRRSIWPDLSCKAVTLVREIYSKPCKLRPKNWLYEKAPSAMRIIHLPKHKLIFLGFCNGMIKIRNLKQCLWTITEHLKTVTSFLFLKEGIWASSSLDGTVRLWRGKEEPTLLLSVDLKTPICQLYLNTKDTISAIAEKTHQIFHLSYDGSSSRTGKVLPSTTLNEIRSDQRKNDNEKLLLHTKSEPSLSNKAPEKPRKKTL